MKKQFDEALEDLIDAYMEGLSRQEQRNEKAEIRDALSLKAKALQDELNEIEDTSED